MDALNKTYHSQINQHLNKYIVDAQYAVHLQHNYSTFTAHQDIDGIHICCPLCSALAAHQQHGYSLLYSSGNMPGP